LDCRPKPKVVLGKIYGNSNNGDEFNFYHANAMNPESITSPFARLAFALLSAMWTVAGWYLFLTKTFTTSPIRSKSSTIVTGYEAQFLGLVFVALGLIAMTILLRSLSVRRAGRVVVLLAFFVVPPFVMQAVIDKL
jgi:hypothetical protein